MSPEKVQAEDLINSVFCAEGQNPRWNSPPRSNRGVFCDALVLICGAERK